jgi:redox-sensitive bicupin YhaK (pirin superfamily)
VLTVRKSDERGKTQTTWLVSRHTFSFGEYRDPSFANFGALHVINEDWVSAGGGFKPHSHENMEILTYLLDGTLEHRDSTGAGGIIRPGEIQRMSAGKGIVHSEFNPSPDKPCHFLQIWIAPSKEGLEPSYEQATVDCEAVQNRFVRIASCDPRTGEVRIVQDADVWAARMAPDTETMHTIAPGRRAWLHVARGNVVLNDTALSAGDGAAITDEDDLLVRVREQSELLLFDLA